MYITTAVTVCRNVLEISPVVLLFSGLIVEDVTTAATSPKYRPYLKSPAARVFIKVRELPRRGDAVILARVVDVCSDFRWENRRSGVLGVDSVSACIVYHSHSLLMPLIVSRG